MARCPWCCGTAWVTGDTYCSNMKASTPSSAAGMTGIASILEENIPGVYVHRCTPITTTARIMIGGNLLVDTESGFFRDTNRQAGGAGRRHPAGPRGLRDDCWGC